MKLISPLASMTIVSLVSSLISFNCYLLVSFLSSSSVKPLKIGSSLFGPTLLSLYQWLASGRVSMLEIERRAFAKFYSSEYENHCFCESLVMKGALQYSSVWWKQQTCELFFLLSLVSPSSYVTPVHYCFLKFLPPPLNLQVKTRISKYIHWVFLTHLKLSISELWCLPQNLLLFLWYLCQ